MDLLLLMIPLASVTAKIEDSKIIIDTRNVAKNTIERKILDPPWWVIGSAAFIFTVNGTETVALVQRTHNVSDPCRWALIPAGVADVVCELKHPSNVIVREGNEELKICQKGEWVSPFHVSTLVSENKVSIYDEFTEETYHDVGHVFTHGKKAYFLRVYKMHDSLKDFILYDGEKTEDGKDLNRVIDLVPINTLKGIVLPLKMFQGKDKITPREIGLTKYETPTLKWFREYV